MNPVVIDAVPVAVWQLRQIGRDRYPVMRAGEALTTTVPLFLLLFASAYFAMARASRCRRLLRDVGGEQHADRR